MLLFRYVAAHYLKYIVVILFALVFFMVGFDFIQVAKDLPDSANLILIYVVFKAFFAVDMMLPLSLVFAMIATKIQMIRTNALVAFYAIGYSKTELLRPFVVVSGGLIVLYIALHTTAFARADEYANNIRSASQFIKPTNHLFFTYQDQYIYFGRLDPLKERAFDIRIFGVDKGDLRFVVMADEARYKHGYWHIDEATRITKPEVLSLSGEGARMTQEQGLKLLKDFRPKILDQVYEGKVNYTIIDAIDTMLLLHDQNVNLDRIKSALYRMFVHPFFVPALIVILFFFVPVSPRFLNLSLFSFAAILATLTVWALLFMMIELSNNKTIPSEAGVVAPVVLLVLIAVWIWNQNRLQARRA